jgi:hypothetical protein
MGAAGGELLAGAAAENFFFKFYRRFDFLVRTTTGEACVHLKN